MATTLSPTALQAMLDAMYTALGSGALSLSYEGKTITYRSSDELRAAIASIENQLSGQLGANTPRTILVRSRKHW
jgi:hypothetical protein